MDVPRGWQAEALDKYLAEARQDWLACATPGAGKTRFSLFVVQRLRPAVIRRVFVVVPTDALRQQWADAAAGTINLLPVGDPSDIGKAGYDGYVVTYQQMARGAMASLARRVVGQSPTLVIFDEIHHAGESRSWAEGLREAFDPATRRLALTGTPWRSDANPIPFVEYEEPDTNGRRRVRVDYSYEYGRAVTDGVCRPVVFHAYDGEARWVDCGQIVDGTLTDDATADAALDTALQPGNSWMPSLLRKAVAELDELRVDVPDAGGLVVADNQSHAREWAAELARITGDQPTVVVSDDPEAKANITRFDKGRSRWLVAVRMVSEGIDIKRLSVGVYATRTATPLFFRQVVGRFVRTRPGEDHAASILVPAVSKLTVHCKQIEEELRHEVEAARKEYESSGGSGQNPLDFREPLSASESTFDRSILSGQEFRAEALDEAARTCVEFGFPTRMAAQMARLLAEKAGGDQPAPEPAATAVPRHRYEKQLRGEIDILAGKIARRAGTEKKDVNARIIKAGFPARKHCTIDQLEQMRDMLARWFGEV
ncbi:DEAD/DEAH box helicase [Parafrankia sp. FMc2]|uniref:DEAD/DEAH box helicase n=1 Tax=Parafrankia sp. FMc2 TaxID=3233196 RepID=UPI0034D5263D